MTGSEELFKAVEHRRTYYNITNKSTLSDEKLKLLVERAVKFAPTAFNMQQSRAVIVTGEKHKEVWEMVEQTFKKTLKGDKKQEDFYEHKIKTQYQAGYGTVLFFEDQDLINTWIGNMPSMAQTFPVWSENATGILQYIVWTALEAEGMGANLQHYAAYSPETQAELTKLVDVPPSWKSTAMMPFGVATGEPGNPAKPKEFKPVEERVKTFFG